MATFKRVDGDYTIRTLSGSDRVTIDTSQTIVTGDLTVVGNAVLTGNINADRIFYGTSNVEIPTVNGNVTISVNGSSNIAVFANTGVTVTGLASVTGNVIGANLNTAGLASVTGNVRSGNLVTLGNVLITRDAGVGTPEIRFNDSNVTVADNTVLGQIVWFTNDASPGARATSIIQSIANGITGNANVQILTSTNGAAATAKMTVLSTGNVGIGNTAPVDVLAVTGTAWFSTTLSAVGNITGGNLLTAGSMTSTGNVQAGNLRTAGLASVTGNINAGNMISAGTVTAGAAGVSATGNVTGGNINSQGRISSVGNITGTDYFGTTLSVTGNITGGNAAITTLITAANANISTLLTGSGVGVENFVYQSVDANVSSVTPANIGSLQFTAVANNAYRFDAQITIVPSGAMTVAPAVSFAAGSCNYVTEIQTTSISAFSTATKTTSDDVATTYGMTGTDARTLRITGWFFHTGNTVVAMRLQNSTGNATIKTGSWLSFTRIA